MEQTPGQAELLELLTSLDPLPSKPFGQSGFRLTAVQHEALDVHVNDLLELRREQQPKYLSGAGSDVRGRLAAVAKARNSPVSAMLRSFRLAVKELVYTLMSNPLIPITDPFVWAYSVAALVLLTIGVALGNTVLTILRVLGFGWVVNAISHRWGGRLSLVNMAWPYVFEPHDPKFPKETIQMARLAMSGLLTIPPLVHHKASCVGDCTTIHVDGTRRVNFDLDVAKYILILASLVYERKESLVSDVPDSRGGARERLYASEQSIHEKAYDLGVRFASVSDFTDVSGSYAGVFWSVKHRFIVLSLKGTTPDNVNEWLVDTTLGHEDARPQIFGAAHGGFYTAIFPSQGSGTKINPYRRIVQMLRRVAAEILHMGADPVFDGTNTNLATPSGIQTSHNDAKVSLYVTGHSLGGALSAILYSRLLLEQGDLGEHIVLRDCYTYGQPRVGNAEFVDGVERLLHAPENSERNIWRVRNEDDVVTTVPPGLADDEERRLYLGNNLLNYGHFGTEVHLAGNVPQYYVVPPGGVRVGDDVVPIASNLSSGFAALINTEAVETNEELNFAGTTPITIISFLMRVWPVNRLRDHFPSQYWDHLERIRGINRFGYSEREYEESIAAIRTKIAAAAPQVEERQPALPDSDHQGRPAPAGAHA